MPRPFRAPKDVGAALDAARKLPLYGRLVWGLLRDGRVPPRQKLILAGIVGYLLVPFDIIPDFIPVVGQLDDLAVVLLGLDLFLRTAPADVVNEHLARISRDEDDLRRDTEQVAQLLGDQFARIRANLERILRRQRSRFRDADEAGEALAKWQEQPAEDRPHGRRRGSGA